MSGKATVQLEDQDAGDGIVEYPVVIKSVPERPRPSVVMEIFTDEELTVLVERAATLTRHYFHCLSSQGEGKMSDGINETLAYEFSQRLWLQTLDGKY